MARVPGAADVHIHQVVDWPEIDVDVDRNKAGQMGLSQRDVSSSLLISLSSSGQVAPTQWMDWNTGVAYSVAVQTPQYRMNSLEALMRTPIGAPFSSVAGSTSTSIAGSANAGLAATGAGPSQASMAYGNPGALASGPQLLSNLAGVRRGVAPEIVNHYNVQPVFDVYANVERSDLGSVGSAWRRSWTTFRNQTAARQLHRSARAGQRPWNSSFTGWRFGMAFAVCWSTC